jgi:hypothetical protein
MNRDWIEREALPGRRIVDIRELTGGYSNHNVVLTTDSGDRYVLRRYLSRALDLYALADLLQRPPEHRYFQRALDRIRLLLDGAAGGPA